MATTPRTKPYVGTAKNRPDSFTPRRFIAVRKATSSSASATRCSASPVKAEMMLSTPAETDTATVRT
jgi:hypothetical protein